MPISISPFPDLRRSCPAPPFSRPSIWSTYLDSGDLRLWAGKITLRHRQGEDEGPGIWTLKLPLQQQPSRTVRSEHTWEGPAGSAPPRRRDPCWRAAT